MVKINFKAKLNKENKLYIGTAKTVKRLYKKLSSQHDEWHFSVSPLNLKEGRRYGLLIECTDCYGDTLDHVEMSVINADRVLELIIMDSMQAECEEKEVC